MAKPAKVLLLYASFGSGHRRAAQAVQEVLQERGITSDIQDLVAFLPQPLKSFYPWAYDFMINDARFLWKFLYSSLNRSSKPYTPGKSKTQRWQFSKLKRYLRDGEFTHIFSTHFTTSAILIDWRKMGALDAQIYSIVTDHVAHRCWKRTGLDHYFVASEGVAHEMEELGVLPNDIGVSGIPVSKAIRKTVTREEARITWNCTNEETVVLILSSGWNYKKTVSLLQEIRDTQMPLRLLISTGPDPAKERKIKRRFSAEQNWTIFGFSSRIAEMMKASDLMITKPGGLIVSEALAMGVPQLLLSPIPGQEEANAEFAEQHGAAICVRDESGALKSVLTEVLANPQRLECMKRAARESGRPNAAIQIVDRVFGVPV